MAIDINKLGVRIDGWADIVEGAGNKTVEARNAAKKVFLEKEMPNVKIDDTTITITKERPFLTIEMPNGACVTVYIGPFGQDLFATWDLYIKPVVRKQILYAILAIAGIMGFIGGFQQDAWTGDTQFSFLSWVFSTISWGLGSAILIGIAGLIVKRNFLAYFFIELDKFDIDDIGAMSLVVHKGLMHALDSIGIRSNLLRMKEQFHAGSRDRII